MLLKADKALAAECARRTLDQLRHMRDAQERAQRIERERRRLEDQIREELRDSRAIILNGPVADRHP